MPGWPPILRPNELACLGQLRGVYEHFGVPMPLFYPRASATILDSAALRFLTKYKLPLEALHSKDEKVSVPPLVGALLKNEQDVTLFEKLVFMQRHNR